MNTNLKTAIAFVLGLGTGAFASYKVLKGYFKKISDEEIEAIRTGYFKKEEALNAKIDDLSDQITTGDKWHNDLLEDICGYTQPENEIPDNPVVTDEPESALDKFWHVKSGPYLIAEEEYGGMYMYAEVELVDFADGIVAEDGEEPLDKEEVNESISLAILDAFRADHASKICIRNDEKECDYILKSDSHSFDYMGNAGDDY